MMSGGSTSYSEKRNAVSIPDPFHLKQNIYPFAIRAKTSFVLQFLVTHIPVKINQTLRYQQPCFQVCKLILTRGIHIIHIVYKGSISIPLFKSHISIDRYKTRFQT